MNIDTKALKQSVNLATLAASYTTLHRVSGTGEMAGPCPRCGGTDRFHCTEDWWFCRKCHEKRGDAIEFITWLEGCTFLEAVDKLGGNLSCSAMPTRPVAPSPTTKQGAPPDAKWQATAWQIIEAGENNLWHEGVGKRARQYLAERGLEEATLRHFRIGYFPKGVKINGFYVRGGVVIPWIDKAGTVWKINVRRLAGDPKYQAVSGSSNKGLFVGAVAQDLGHTTCIVAEGEFDAMLAYQYVNLEADVITMGGATCKVTDRWLPLLLKYDRFLVVTDNDKAGEKAAAAWLSLVGNKGHRLVVPEGKDITDYWQAGGDVQALLSVPECETQHVQDGNGAIDTATPGQAVEDLMTMMYALEAAFEASLEEPTDTSRLANATDATRVSFCGRHMFGVEPKTGGKYVYRYRCGKWRLCPDCARHRAEQEQKRMEAAFGVDNAYVATGSEADIRKLISRLQDKAGGGHYRRYPMADGTFTVIHNVEGETGERTGLASLNWDTLTATPEHRNISGKLKAPAPVEEADMAATKQIKIRTVAPDKPVDMGKDEFDRKVDDCFEVAVLKTSHLTPDLETIESCLAARQDEFELQLQAVGMDTRFSVVRHATINENEIDWEPVNERIRRKRSVLSEVAGGH